VAEKRWFLIQAIRSRHRKRRAVRLVLGRQRPAILELRASIDCGQGPANLAANEVFTGRWGSPRFRSWCDHITQLCVTQASFSSMNRATSKRADKGQKTIRGWMRRLSAHRRPCAGRPEERAVLQDRQGNAGAADRTLAMSVTETRAPPRRQRIRNVSRAPIIPLRSGSRLIERAGQAQGSGERRIHR
jgi:hypothetical protein